MPNLLCIPILPMKIKGAAGARRLEQGSTMPPNFVVTHSVATSSTLGSCHGTRNRKAPISTRSAAQAILQRTSPA
jgi:hypothetical protein